jgi:hypothetical protein
MIKGCCFPFHLLAGTAVAALIAAGAVVSAQSGNSGEKPDDININRQKQITEPPAEKTDDDWLQYILHGDGSEDSPASESDDNFSADGYFKAGVVYGKSKFTSSKYRRSADDRPTSLVIKSGAVPVNEYKILAQGKAGKRLTVYIDHDSTRENKDDNKYYVQYRAEHEDELLQELNAGDIDIAATGSKYAVFESKAEKAYGVDMTFRKKAFTLKSFASISKGNAETETFKGTATPGSISVADYQFIRNKYFQLEPYARYDNIRTAAAVTALGTGAYTSLNVFTSNPAAPSSYILYPVTIESGSFELWIDDQSGVKKNGTFSSPPDGGSYIRMTEGSDFSVNYSTGEIKFLATIADASHIFAAYRLSGGSVATCDPAARLDIVSGKIFVYIKYGSSIDEDIDKDGVSNGDVNKDGVTNHDIYEIRSYYSMADKGIKSDTLKIDVYEDNRLLSEGVSAAVGRYDADCTNGLLRYYTREPFRPLLSTGDASRIYGTASSSAYLYSHFTHKMSYYRDARVFQLKHTNIIEGSVTVKLNGSVVPASLYSVNTTVGIVEFSNSSNPVISDSSQIEIRYQYSAVGNAAQSFTGGVRGEYRLNDMLSFGGTMLYSKQGSDEKIPTPGNEPTATAVFEGDTTLSISRARFGKFASALTGSSVREIPLEFKGYAEYAKSYRKENTFGKVIVDDIESAAETTEASMTERDWFLSSMPSGNTRGKLYYKYYRNPSSADTLKDESFGAYAIDYSVKAGPYNILAGHNTYSESDKNKSRKSVAFDFDFTEGNSVSAAVRLDSNKKEVDLSGLQYVEVWYRAFAGSGNVQFTLEAGQINEDSDGDGILDTEDTNSNGYLDSEEDKGYAFNPSGYSSSRIGGGPALTSYTVGDGALSTEDINGNGTLDTTENTVSFPGPKSYEDGKAANIPIQVSLADTGWKSAKIYLNRNTMTASDKSILSTSRVLRINIKNVSASSGKIMFDSIRFVCTKWKNTKINGVEEENPAKFKVAVIDTQNDSEYNAHSFVREKGSTYKDMYGSRSSEEMNDEYESALSVTYNLSGSTGSISRTFPRSIDLSKYRTVNMWMNPREMTSGDIFRFYIGTSENDCYVYDKTIESSGSWQEISLKLTKSSSGTISASQTLGYPELSAVRFMKIEIISSAAGRIWVDNVIASDPVSSTGEAYWTEANLKVTRPLYITDNGTEVVKDLSFSYTQRSHSGDFSSPGRTDYGTAEKIRDFRTSCEIIPRMDFVSQITAKEYENRSFSDSVSAENRGRRNQNTCLFQLGYTSISLFIPSINILYRYDKTDTARDDIQTDGDKILVAKTTVTHAPRVSVEERIMDFIGGKWIFSVISDNTFCSSRDTLSESRSIDARQKNDLRLKTDYEIGYFFLTPELDLYNHEINKFAGKSSTEILANPDSGYHMPFFADSGFKYSERNLSYSLKTGTRRTELFAPIYQIDYKYYQNGFKDYLAGETSEYTGFLRSHNAQSSAGSDLQIPLLFKNFEMGYLKSLTFRYQRRLTFEETEVPYESERKGLFDEKYGISESKDTLTGNAYNYVSMYPFYFLGGRHNYANGRDFVYKHMNSKIYFGNNVTSPYDNSLKIADNTSISPSFQFSGVDVTSSAGIDHLSERSSIGGIPGQQITWYIKNDVSINLMNIFSFGFFRPNSPDLTKHGAKIDLGYSYSRCALITKNLMENKYTPSAGFSLFWGVSSLTVKGAIDFRTMKHREYISEKNGTRDSRDDIYFNALSLTRYSENSRGYSLTTRYETQTEFIHSLIKAIYPLSTAPQFIAEYEYLKNSYNYINSVSPEPYDRHLLSGSLKFDFHKNVKAVLTGKTAIERWYDRETHNLYKEVFSYEFSGEFILQF